MSRTGRIPCFFLTSRHAAFLLLVTLTCTLQITVPAYSLYADDGTRGGQVGISPVPPDRLPGELPEDFDLPLVITVQTDGATNFDVPVPVRFPNLQGLPPGARAGLTSFNHDIGDWEVVGSMTVSADGRIIESDPGTGILAPGWHSWTLIVLADGTEIRVSPDGREYVWVPAGLPDPELYPRDGQSFTSCNIFFHNGEEFFDVTDLAIPGRGEVHFQLTRRYRSRMVFDGPLGHSWDFVYDDHLFVQENGDVIRTNGFGRDDRWVRTPDGRFTSPPGFFSVLRQEPDGVYVLREPNGFKRFYTPEGFLFCHQDRFGNRMTFHYDAEGCLDLVVDPFGREIDFTFEEYPDGGTRLARVRDFLGRAVVYTYDDRGDLVEVRSPVVVGTSTGNDFPEGRTERYVYSSGYTDERLNHNIIERYQPQEVASGGPPALVWTYGTDLADPDTYDRVIARTKGGTNASGVPAGGSITIDYQSLNQSVPPGNPDLVRFRTTHTDRNQNVTEYDFNELRLTIAVREHTRGLRPDEPPFYETRSFYDSDGQLVRRVYPEGNELLLTYQQTGARLARSNVVERRKVAGPRGGGEDIVETFTYEPLYQQLSTATGPRGNASDFVPPLGIATPERYTTRLFYDYQEHTDPVPDAVQYDIDLSGVTRGLGDLNGDGRLDQTAGHLVRTERPTVQLRPESELAFRQGGTEQLLLDEVQWRDTGQPLARIDAEGNTTLYEYHPERDPDGDGVNTLSVFRPLRPADTGYLKAITEDAAPASPRRTALAPPAELRTEFAYDRAGNLTWLRTPRGVVTETEVNALNEPVAVTRGADVSEAEARGELLTGEAAFRYRTLTHYDHNGRVIRTEVENRDGNTAGVGEFVEHTFQYDLLDQLVASTVEVAADTFLTTGYRYDPNENPTEVIQPEGNSARTVYDERDLPLTVTQGFGSPEAATVSFTYDLNGSVAERRDAEDHDGDSLGDPTRYTYDGFDRLIKTTDALGNVSEQHYDIASNLVSQEVWGHPADQPEAPLVLLSQVLVHHDELGRAFQTDQWLFVPDGFALTRDPELQDGNADGWVTDFVEYDALSRVVFVIEDDGETSETVYDGASRVVESIDAAGNVALIQYDQASNPVLSTQIEVGAGLPDEVFTTSYVYDQLDRLVRTTDNAGQTVRLQYDSRDNVVLRTDAKGPPIDDPLGLFPGSINGPGNPTRFIYDGLDRQIAEVTELRTGGSGEGALDTSNPDNPDGLVRVDFFYDGNSRLDAIADDNGNTTGYRYDALDRQTAEENADGTEHTYAYDRDGNLVSATDPNGTTITRTYDALNRLTQTDVQRAAGVVGTTHETYSYDGLSRVTRSTDDNGGGSPVVIERVYDSLSRLVEERLEGRVTSQTYSGDSRRVSCTYPGGRRIDYGFDEIDRAVSVSDAGGVIATFRWMGPGFRPVERLNANGTRESYLDPAGTTLTGYDPIRRVVGLQHRFSDGAPFVDRQYGYDRASNRTREVRVDDQGLTDHYAYDSAHRILQTLFDQDAPGAPDPRDLAERSYQLDGVGNRRQVVQDTLSGGAMAVSYAVNEMCGCHGRSTQYPVGNPLFSPPGRPPFPAHLHPD